MSDFVGRYYSNEWIRRNVLRQTEEDMKEIDKQIKEEEKIPQYQEPIMPQQGSEPQPSGSGQ
jgi:hypothetical protein